MLEIADISVLLEDFDLSNVSLKIEQGEYHVLVGPSGAGKTVLLETIAGFHKVKSGTIKSEGRNLTYLPIGKRNIGIVYQDFNLFPHMKVGENIAFALKHSRMKRPEVQNQVQQIADSMDIGHLLQRFPVTLSGGEQQRVALARSLVMNPEVLLLDEPLSAIDAALHHSVKKLLKAIHHSGITVLHVTHDFDEAASLGQKLSVMKDGRIIQTGNIHDLLHSPCNEFVAAFGGTKNIFPVIHRYETDGAVNIKVSETVTLTAPAITPGTKTIFFRNSEASIVDIQHPGEIDNILEGTITDITRQKYGYELTVDCGIIVFIWTDEHSFAQCTQTTGNKVKVRIPAKAILPIE